MSKYIYGVTCKNQYIQSFFDLLLILLSNPHQDKICSSHITLKGPYDKAREVEPEDDLFDKNIYLSKIDIFDTKKGSALVFIIEMNNISKVWHKPDYPNGKPHLTIFEGDSNYTKSLYDKIGEFKKNLLIEITPLRQINKKYMPAREFQNYEQIKSIYELIYKMDWPGPGRIAKFSTKKKTKMFLKGLDFIYKLNSDKRNNRNRWPTSFSKSISSTPKYGSLI